MAELEHILPVFSTGRADKAVSIIEVLVIGGIVGVLVALILPVLRTMQNNALTARCASNLRSLAEAGRLYANDHNGEFTSINYINSINDDLPGLREYVGQSRRTTGIDTVFTCPALQRSNRTTAYALNHNYALNKYASSDYTRGGKGKALKRFQLIAKPASMAYFMDSYPATADSQGWYYTVGVIEDDYGKFIYPHQHTQQVIFLDGHMELLNAAQVSELCSNAALRGAFWQGSNL